MDSISDPFFFVDLSGHLSLPYQFAECPLQDDSIVLLFLRKLLLPRSHPGQTTKREALNGVIQEKSTTS